MKKAALFIALVAVVVVGYLAFTTVAPTATAPVAVAKGRTYSAKMYISAMGGHFAVADVTIDPSKEQPIIVNDLDKIDIGTKTSHPTHDPRIDATDRTKIFWSTYKLDENGMVRVGVSDLNTGKVIKEVALKPDERAKWTGALYCGSGQTKDSYLPVTMTDEAYIDVFDKKTLELKQRVFLDYKPGQTKFYHGINSPDMKKFAVVVNLADEGKPNGKIDVIMLDLPQLEKGKVKVLAKTTLTGEAGGKTLTFRQYFTNDNKYFLQSGKDRMYVLDANTLKLVDEELLPPGENHDVMPTPDGKYAVLTMRETIKNKEGKDTTDGTLLLYDMGAKKVIGKSSSVCYRCHEGFNIMASSVLCGIDANYKN